MRITEARHPEYTDDANDFFKWRLCYKGGRHFIDAYLQRFSKREDDAAFKERMKLSYAPTYAKMGITKIKNTFFSRMSEIIREGSDGYEASCRGEKGGVDLYGSSMNSFIGTTVLEELMVMRRVGVFVDKQQLDGDLLALNNDKKPYLYIYKAENILSWDMTYSEGEHIYYNVLLRDCDYKYDENTGLPSGTFERYRHMWLAINEDTGKIETHIQFYLPNKTPNAKEDTKDGPEIVLPLERLPFIVAELRESLMVDIADYQIGLLNLASADMNYVYKANFPFYIEQFDPASDSPFMRGPLPPAPATFKSTANITAPPTLPPNAPSPSDPGAGTQDEGVINSPNKEIAVGVLQGRRYPKGMDAPGFIHPSAEPLNASVSKQEQMRGDIMQLLDIAVASAVPAHASADSKAMDDRSIESGLSYIGLELEYLEREIAKIWAMYQNEEVPTVKYPTKYTLKSDADRLEDAAALDKIKTSAPSRTFAKEVTKQIARVMLCDKIPYDVLKKIEKEIDDAEFISSDPALIEKASQLGMVSAETGSYALGFDGKKEVPIAKKEHTERLAEIAKAQSEATNVPPGAASGVKDTNDNPGKDVQDKTNPKKAPVSGE